MARWPVRETTQSEVRVRRGKCARREQRVRRADFGKTAGRARDECGTGAGRVRHGCRERVRATAHRERSRTYAEGAQGSVRRGGLEAVAEEDEMGNGGDAHAAGENGRRQHKANEEWIVAPANGRAEPRAVVVPLFNAAVGLTAM